MINWPHHVAVAFRFIEKISIKSIKQNNGIDVCLQDSNYCAQYKWKYHQSKVIASGIKFPKWLCKHLICAKAHAKAHKFPYSLNDFFSKIISIENINGDFSSPHPKTNTNECFFISVIFINRIVSEQIQCWALQQSKLDSIHEHVISAAKILNISR